MEHKRQTCTGRGLWEERNDQLVPTPEYATRASARLGKSVSRWITHFYLSSLLQSLFRFYVSLKSLLFGGAWFGGLLHDEYWKWVITDMPGSTLSLSRSAMLIRPEHLVCLLYSYLPRHSAFLSHGYRRALLPLFFILLSMAFGVKC